MNLLKTLATVGGMTMISRLLGFVRDTVIARAFGAGMAADAFFIAFKLPNLLRRVFAEGAFSQAFVPILAEYRARGDAEETRSLIDHVATMLTLALAVVTVAGLVAAPFVVWVNAPGFSANPAKFELTVRLLRVTLPYILLISLASLIGGILNTWSLFSVPAFTPTFLNLAFIFFVLFLRHWFHPPVMALAWAVLAGGVLQIAFQLPHLFRLRLTPRWRLGWHHPGMRRVMRQMGPAVFGVSVSQISLIINTIIASFLVTGSVSWLYYADRLMELPTGVLGVALGTILLPSLSRHHAEADMGEYSRLLDWGLRLTFLLAAPSAVGLCVLAHPMVITLFQYGHYSLHDAAMTEQAVISYSVGLVGLILVKVLAPGFYAQQNIKTPVKIALTTLAATQIMNGLFVWRLHHAGLALSIGLAACMNAALLYTGLRRRGFYQPQPGWGRFALNLSAALLAMGMVLWLGADLAGDMAPRHAAERVAILSAEIAAGAAAYFAVLLACGIHPRQFMRRAKV